MSSRKTRTMYMHTLDAKPATWSERDQQIVFADDDQWRGRNTKATLRPSLRQIRRDQARTIANRKEWGFADPPSKHYGYVLVEVPS